MVLADKLGPATAVKGPPCGVTQLLERLDRDSPDDAATLREWLANPEIRYSVISDALAEDGHRLQADTLSRHCRGRCLCKGKLR